MYSAAGYGENWQPQANTARRFNPYRASYKALACLFIAGFLLIVIVVLSLLPLYLAQRPAAKYSYILVAKIFIAGYTLQFQAPSPNFQSDTILSDSNNRQNLQAALTSLIQKDALLAGSIVEVNQTWTRRRLRQRRRRASSLLPLIFDLYMTTGKSCVSPLCISQWQNSTVNILSSTNPRLPVARYDYQNTSISYRLEYQLPFTFHTNISLVTIDPKTIASILATLLARDRTNNLASANNMESSTPSLPS